LGRGRGWGWGENGDENGNGDRNGNEDGDGKGIILNAYFKICYFIPFPASTVESFERNINFRLENQPDHASKLYSYYISK
jgi:hypothetical protein